MRGNFTCINHNGASVVGYDIASSDLFPYISYFCVENRDESIHFPLNCQLKFPNGNHIPKINNTNKNMRPIVKYK